MIITNTKRLNRTRKAILSRSPDAKMRLVLISILLSLVSMPCMVHAEPCSDAEVGARDDGRWPVELSFGTRAIFSGVTFHGEDAADAVVKVRTLPSFGTFAGVLSAKELFKWRAGVLFDFSYMTKGTGLRINNRYAGSMDLRYFDLLLLTRLEHAMGERLHGYLVAGPRLSILRDAKDVYADGGYLDRTPDMRARDIGLVAGAGVGWDVRPQHRVIFDIRVDTGFKTIDATINNSQLKNLAISLSLGYQWSYPPRAAKTAPCPEF